MNYLHKEMLNLRSYDEKAKELNKPIKKLNYYKEMLRNVLNNKNNSS